MIEFCLGCICGGVAGIILICSLISDRLQEILKELEEIQDEF